MLKRRGQILWALVLVVAVAVAPVIWVTRSRQKVRDTRQPIVFWGSKFVGDEVYTLVRQFEKENPQYHVIMSSAVARDLTGDAQRLLCATVGGVPPDIVWFDRFAIGEWAGRGALTDLKPLIEKQSKDDPYRIDLSQFYKWTLEEASYRKPGSKSVGLYGLPTTADTRVMYINADLLRQEGLVDSQGNPQPPRNWKELRAYANKLTRYINPNNKSDGIRRLGFAPNFGNSWLYLYGWQAGGHFMNADHTKVTMDSPPIVRALKFITDIYDDLGGYPQVASFQSAFQAGPLDPFLRGQIAMEINVDSYLNTIADWRRNMDFIVAPAPIPQDQLDLGRKPLGWSGGWSLVIPATAKNKVGAFKLMQFLYSWKGVTLLEQGKREQKEAEGRIYLPGILANRVHYERLVRKYIDGNPNLPRRFKQAYAVFTELMQHTKIRPVTPVGQMMSNEQVRANDAAVNHAMRAEAQRTGQDEIKLCLSSVQAEVQRQLDQTLSPPPPTKVDWWPYLIGYVLLLLTPVLVMFVLYKRRRKEYGYKAREVGAAMVFASPWLIGFAVMCGGPILFSIIFSFTRYNVPLAGAVCGAGELCRGHSRSDLLQEPGEHGIHGPADSAGDGAEPGDRDPAEQRRARIGFYRTAFYLPAIMPMVAASLLWLWVFNPSYGLLNEGLAWLYSTAPAHWLEALIGLIRGHPFHFTMPLWLSDPKWSKPSLILMNLWTAGGGMIIWLAGLQSIPGQQYEAASIDGAGAWRRFWHITVPMISPYILFNLVIGLIGTMQIFSEAYIMTAGGPVDSTLFYAYYLFKEAFQFFRMGYASAMAWILFVIVLALTLVQLWLSKKWVHYDQS